MRKSLIGIAILILGGCIAWLSADLLSHQIPNIDPVQETLSLQITELKDKVTRLEQQLSQLLNVIKVTDEDVYIKAKYIYLGEKDYEQVAYYKNDSEKKIRYSETIWVTK